MFLYFPVSHTFFLSASGPDKTLPAESKIDFFR
jgi:hypothetical protein